MSSDIVLNAFNALIFPILRGCVQSFVIFLSLNSIPSWYCIEGLEWTDIRIPLYKYSYISFCGLVLDTDFGCGTFCTIPYIRRWLHLQINATLFNDLYECFSFLDGIHTNMTIINRVKITISPRRLHAASSVRIPTSTRSLPTVRIRPLNLFSASSVDLHGASNNLFFAIIWE